MCVCVLFLFYFYLFLFIFFLFFLYGCGGQQYKTKSFLFLWFFICRSVNQYSYTVQTIYQMYKFLLNSIFIIVKCLLLSYQS